MNIGKGGTPSGAHSRLHSGTAGRPPHSGRISARPQAPNPGTSRPASLQSRLQQERTRRLEAERALEAARLDMEMTTGQMEAAIARANDIAVQGQIISIELNQIFNTAADGMWVLDRKFNILRINDTFLTLLARTPEETVGRKSYDVFPGTHGGFPGCPAARLARGEPRVEYDLELELAGRGRKSFLVTATPFSGLDGELIGIVEAYKDITERKQIEEALRRANEELQRLASLDGLTQIANRRRFDEYLRMEWKRLTRAGKPLSLILSDVDAFKLYNDTYGHQAGDDCLRAVAHTIERFPRRSTDLTARYGGEEFAVILSETDAAVAVRIAEAFGAAVAGMAIEHRTSPTAPFVTLSSGVATRIPDRESDPASLILAADRALYAAKENGRNRVVCLD